MKRCFCTLILAFGYLCVNHYLEFVQLFADSIFAILYNKANRSDSELFYFTNAQFTYSYI